MTNTDPQDPIPCLTLNPLITPLISRDDGAGVLAGQGWSGVAHILDDPTLTGTTQLGPRFLVEIKSRAFCRSRGGWGGEEFKGQTSRPEWSKRLFGSGGRWGRGIALAAICRWF